MENYRIKPGQEVLVKDFDPHETSNWKGDKASGLQRLEELKVELDQLQDVLYAESKHRVLIIIQAMDTAGKDGTIRSVFGGINPQGVRVASFKVPTAPEMAHDYLWRFHPVLPGNGEIVIFNRSYYEDVLVVRVHNFVPETTWQKRYQHINEFERMLTDEGTTILKFYLHIDAAEQKKRLLDRLIDPTKNWKFSSNDMKERTFWPAYMEAYQVALSKTSSEAAPWYLIPSNHNWYRNLMVASVIVATLKGLKMAYPTVTEDLAPFRKQLEAE
jgi:PPK2 family polyphosphate:nucleotide phosphotransferase